MGTNLVFSGIRSSIYGFAGGFFPSPDEAANLIKNVSKKLGNTTPSAVWVVGTIQIQDGGVCRLEFPAHGRDIISIGQDRHEEYLKKFDEIGAKIFLQVEAGTADMKTLIELVMKQYKHHPCVAGFGIDVEWYPSDGKPNSSEEPQNFSLTNAKIEDLDAYLKTFGSHLRLFVKHWEPAFLGTGPVSDVIYISDSQELGSISNMAEEFEWWAGRFAPNDIGFQIGYNSDKPWWNPMKDPISEIAKELRSRIKNQNVHIYWVDFSIRDGRFAELWKSQ